MSGMNYTYAVARIRCKELSLLSSAAIGQLLARRTYEEGLQFLQERGWGDADTPRDADAILTREKEKTWETVRELIQEDAEALAVLNYPDVFHNLKAAIKQVASGGQGAGIFYQGTDPSPEVILEAVKERDFQKLPEFMQEVAEDALELLLHTRDGQLCDVMIDRAALDAVREAGKASRDATIRDYAEISVAVADIKIAVRCAKTGKSLEFMRRALAPCDSLDTELLGQAAIQGQSAIRDYLQNTRYAGGAEALGQSLTAFECWCDNQIIEEIRPQKYNSFTMGPIVAYALARENEIKTVRIILSGKQSGLSDDSIRERVREMYV